MIIDKKIKNIDCTFNLFISNGELMCESMTIAKEKTHRAVADYWFEKYKPELEAESKLVLEANL